MDTRRQQQIVPFYRRRLAGTRRQHRQNRQDDNRMNKVHVIKESLRVGRLDAHALKTSQARWSTANAIDQLQWLLHSDRALDVMRSIQLFRGEGQAIGSREAR